MFEHRMASGDIVVLVNHDVIQFMTFTIVGCFLLFRKNRRYKKTQKVQKFV